MWTYSIYCKRYYVLYFKQNCNSNIPKKFQLYLKYVFKHFLKPNVLFVNFSRLISFDLNFYYLKLISDNNFFLANLAQTFRDSLWWPILNSTFSKKSNLIILMIVIF